MVAGRRGGILLQWTAAEGGRRGEATLQDGPRRVVSKLRQREWKLTKERGVPWEHQRKGATVELLPASSGEDPVPGPPRRASPSFGLYLSEVEVLGEVRDNPGAPIYSLRQISRAGVVGPRVNGARRKAEGIRGYGEVY